MTVPQTLDFPEQPLGTRHSLILVNGAKLRDLLPKAAPVIVFQMMIEEGHRAEVERQTWATIWPRQFLRLSGPRYRPDDFWAEQK